ncbi:MAG: type II secretion system F family protein [Romboutsia sp.]|nr:type II secretion system F family protein [Romboutsia sp.]
MGKYKCIYYDEYNERKIDQFNFDCEEDIINYAITNNFKIASIKNIERNIFQRNKVGYKDLRILCNEMSILLESGCEIAKLFEMLKDNSSKDMVKILNKVFKNIQKGNSISDSFKYTNKFSIFFVSMIKAGEISGNLDEVMIKMYEYYEKEYKLKSKMISIMIYPIILIIASICVILFMLIAIVPNYESIFITNGTKPPFITSILINTSIFLRKNYILITLFIILSMYLLVYKLKTSQNIQILIEKIQLKIPIINNIIRLAITTKFSRAFYILNKSGVDIRQTIDISFQIIENHTLNKQIINCKESISRGNSISKSLRLVDIFPNLFLTMITIGEENGRLDESLSSINKFYEQELESKIEQGMKIFEQAITIVISMTIGFMVFAMFSPMFDAISSI